MAFIKGKQLEAGTVDTRELKNSAVTTAKLSGSVPASKVDLSDSFDFSTGALVVATPTLDGHAANKAYADGSSVTITANGEKIGRLIPRAWSDSRDFIDGEIVTVLICGVT